jgi:hypothetical protein
MSDTTIKEMIDFEYGITESTPVQKSLFFGQLKLKTYPANTLLLQQGHLPNEIVSILEGEVTVT